MYTAVLSDGLQIEMSLEFDGGPRSRAVIDIKQMLKVDDTFLVDGVVVMNNRKPIAFNWKGDADDYKSVLMLNEAVFDHILSGIDKATKSQCLFDEKNFKMFVDKINEAWYADTEA